MGKFIFTATDIEGLTVIEPKLYGDNRGHFFESYQAEEFKSAGINAVFIQDNQSKSRKGTLRGMHFQNNYSQCKLVRVISGEVFDVAVDLRQGSQTFGKWFGITLSSENKLQFYIPKGFAHGFLVLSDEAEFVYKCDEFYHPEDEGGLLWNDPDIGIDWPVPEGMELLLSEKDKMNPKFSEIKQKFGEQA